MDIPSITYPGQLDPVSRERVEKLATQVEAPHERIVYGQRRQVQPTFCRAVIGDGSHLLIVTGLRTAPAYHALLVDSSWVRPASSPLISSGIEVDLDDADRRDLVAEVLSDVCGDGDRWHEENGEELVTPHGLFCRDMGFSYGIEQLGPDGLLVDLAQAA